MGILDSFKNSIQNHFDKQKEEREMIERIQKEARAHKLIVMEEQFRTDSFKVAEATAKKEAATKSGFAKLRATNRARNLANPQNPPDSFFAKMQEYTQKNMANRERNLKRTEEMRKTAETIKEERATKIKREREERLAKSNSPRSIGQSSWKM